MFRQVRYFCNQSKLTYKQLRFEIKGNLKDKSCMKFIEDEATKLKLFGYVRNTPRNTLIGEAQGNELSIDNLKSYLNTSQDLSRVKTDLRFNEKSIKRINYVDFISDNNGFFDDFQLFDKYESEFDFD